MHGEAELCGIVGGYASMYEFMSGAVKLCWLNWTVDIGLCGFSGKLCAE